MKQSEMKKAVKRRVKGTWPPVWKRAEYKAANHRSRQIGRQLCQREI